MPHDAAPRPQQRGSETAMINGMCESEGSGDESSDLDRNAIQKQRQNRDSPDLAGQACSPHFGHTISHGIAILHIRYHTTSRPTKDA
ncbi:uncharacterized protein Bfra_011415 [Botrytis fragariae]|uniref:Uncharacterized protein n=1 Tax=Botrytis fragariae TaxID=1964551 RepID=A0A8H6AXW3_9HELO|nr:uncharacterized protein Bfra_011415 [Botrytis fragariae]KAF5875653.1 hypothetical protein Bfra_011415 [Botrytis fragariae]